MLIARIIMLIARIRMAATADNVMLALGLGIASTQDYAPDRTTMAKQLFERELEWGNPSRALRVASILVCLQAFMLLGMQWMASAADSRPLLGMFRNAQYILAAVGVGYAVELIRTGIARERWVGAALLVCTVVIVAIVASRLAF